MARIDGGLDLDGVQTFVTVIEGGDFAAAAKRTGLTRSAVAKAVARLEAHLGVRLLHRTTRRTSHTVDGEMLYERLRAILTDVEDAVRTGREHARGTLRLSAPGACGRIRFLP